VLWLCSVTRGGFRALGFDFPGILGKEAPNGHPSGFPAPPNPPHMPQWLRHDGTSAVGTPDLLSRPRPAVVVVVVVVSGPQWPRAPSPEGRWRQKRRTHGIPGR
jgi:hypothetical protein